ncbi:MAG: CotH kinase family protein [Lachnospiraceae bacterium]|nr:CotH kinase family protein [Lachnospiraceae bacterium]
MRRVYVCFAILLFSVWILAAGMLVYGGRIVGNGMAGTKRWKEESGQIYVSVPFSRFRSQTIRFWWNEKESKYYLFLPSFWSRGDCLKLWSADGAELTLRSEGGDKETDGSKTADGGIDLSLGKTDELAEGTYTLTVNGEAYALEIMASSEIPALFVDMENDKLDALYETPYGEQYGAGALLIGAQGQVENEGGVEALRVRGNTSADWVKKPYQMTMNRATDFLGMGSAVKWNLLSNWSDKTLLRNKITYDMAAQAGMPYSPKSAFVDLYLNGEYQGCYQLCEKVEIGANRVNIRNLEDYTLYEPSQEERDMESVASLSKEDPQAAGIEQTENGIVCRGYETQLGTDDITGGYLLEIERPSRIYASPSFFITAHGQPVTVKRPKYADKEEVVYIAGAWQAFEDALYAEDGKNPGTGFAYTDYIDQESFVKKYLVEEIVRNYDASSTSQYFYKDADETDGKIYAGPVWDYDMSLGNPIMSPLTNQHYISSVSPYGLFAALPMDEFSIWYRLYEKEDFRKAVQKTYAEEFLPLLKELEDGGIGAWADTIRESALMDGVRWGRNKGTDQASRMQEYAESVAELGEFVETREAYLTGLWVDGRESKKVYLDGGDADMYISYVETLVGDVLEEPIAPVKEGYTFVRWLNGYTKEPYDFSQPYDGSDLYFVAEYRSDADGSTLIAGE